VYYSHDQPLSIEMIIDRDILWKSRTDRNRVISRWIEGADRPLFEIAIQKSGGAIAICNHADHPAQMRSAAISPAWL
jgi:hypothetical protein